MSDGTRAGTRQVADVVSGLRGSDPEWLLATSLGLFFSAKDAAGRSQLWRLVGEELSQLTQFAEPAYVQAVAEVGGRVLFSGWDPEHGTELWVTDGTAAGSVILADINPGSEDSVYFGDAPYFPWPRRYGVHGGVLIFQALDAASGAELWRSDGIPGGTFRVADLEPGPEGSSPFGFFESPLGLFFRSFGTSSRWLWRSDGTAAGTRLLADVNPIDFTWWEGAVWFQSWDQQYGVQLWSSDGTIAGTARRTALADVELPGYPHWMGATDNGLVSPAAGDGLGLEPWVFDGSPTGAQLLGDLASGPEPSYAPFTIVLPQRLGPWLLFYAWTPEIGWELWRTDGTPVGTALVKDIDSQTPVVDFVYGAPLTPIVASAGNAWWPSPAETRFGASYWPSVWRSDGTPTGSVEIPLEESGRRPVLLGEAPSGRFVLSSQDGQDVRHLWSVGPGDVAEVIAEGPSIVGWFADGPVAARAGDSLLFGSEDQLWATGGTAVTTTPLAAVTVQTFHTLGTDLAFFPGSANGERRLWRSDGTGGGTFPIGPPEGAGRVAALADGTAAFFVGDLGDWSSSDPTASPELWITDGTLEGTEPVAPVPLRPDDRTDVLRVVPVSNPALAGHVLLFAALDPVAGDELWTSDLTPDGTHLFLDLRPGPVGSEPRFPTTVGQRVFFVADDGVHGRELWVSDGSKKGTRMVRDIRKGPESALPQHLGGAGSGLLFAADDEAHGLELWWSDGTTGGTFLLQDLNPGPGSSTPHRFTAVPALGEVFFFANDGEHGFELWAIQPGEIVGPLFTDGFESGDTSTWSPTTSGAPAPRAVPSRSATLKLRRESGDTGAWSPPSHE